MCWRLWNGRGSLFLWVGLWIILKNFLLNRSSRLRQLELDTSLGFIRLSIFVPWLRSAFSSNWAGLFLNLQLMLINNLVDYPEGELREMHLVLLFRSGFLFFSILRQLLNSFRGLVVNMEGVRWNKHELSSEILIAPRPLNEGDVNFMEVVNIDCI